MLSLDIYCILYVYSEISFRFALPIIFQQNFVVTNHESGKTKWKNSISGKPWAIDHYLIPFRLFAFSFISFCVCIFPFNLNIPFVFFIHFFLFLSFPFTYSSFKNQMIYHHLGGLFAFLFFTCSFIFPPLFSFRVPPPPGGIGR